METCLRCSPKPKRILETKFRCRAASVLQEKVLHENGRNTEPTRVKSKGVLGREGSQIDHVVPLIHRMEKPETNHFREQKSHFRAQFAAGF